VELDGLRGTAAFLVVLYHYFFRYNDIYGHTDIPVDWIKHGDKGVQLFFIVSGFVIYWTLNRIKNPKEFIISRFSRLYPTYWFCAVLTFLAVLVVGLDGREISYIDVLLNILMFHQYLGVKHIDGVYWTLTIELTFYFWMISFYMLGILRHVEYIFCSILITYIAQETGFISIPKTVSYFFLINQIPFFIAGICFYKMFNQIASKQTYFILIISLFSTLVEGIDNFYIYSIFYTVFFLCITNRIPFFKNKVFVFMGGISYALYLVHQNIGYIIINSFNEYNISPYIGIFIATSFSILLAYLITKYIEGPSIKKIKDIITKR
jgi:peptidoglycan/LPS O-acetylase OafA/YrhL